MEVSELTYLYDDSALIKEIESKKNKVKELSYELSSFCKVDSIQFSSYLSVLLNNIVEGLNKEFSSLSRLKSYVVDLDYIAKGVKVFFQDGSFIDFSKGEKESIEKCQRIAKEFSLLLSDFTNTLIKKEKINFFVKKNYFISTEEIEKSVQIDQSFLNKIIFEKEKIKFFFDLKLLTPSFLSDFEKKLYKSISSLSKKSLQSTDFIKRESVWKINFDHKVENLEPTHHSALGRCPSQQEEYEPLGTITKQTSFTAANDLTLLAQAKIDYVIDRSIYQSNMSQVFSLVPNSDLAKKSKILKLFKREWEPNHSKKVQKLLQGGPSKREGIPFSSKRFLCYPISIQDRNGFYSCGQGLIIQKRYKDGSLADWLNTNINLKKSPTVSFRLKLFKHCHSAIMRMIEKQVVHTDLTVHNVCFQFDDKKNLAHCDIIDLGSCFIINDFKDLFEQIKNHNIDYRPGNMKGSDFERLLNLKKEIIESKEGEQRLELLERFKMQLKSVFVYGIAVLFKEIITGKPELLDHKIKEDNIANADQQPMIHYLKTASISESHLKRLQEKGIPEKLLTWVNSALEKPSDERLLLQNDLPSLSSLL